jgi:hypothetical protein
MADTMTYLFGPISDEYCILFYALSIIAFVYLVLFIIATIYYALTNKINNKFVFGVSVVSVSLYYFVVYLQNRLLHGMCMKK